MKCAAFQLLNAWYLFILGLQLQPRALVCCQPRGEPQLPPICQERRVPAAGGQLWPGGGVAAAEPGCPQPRPGMAVLRAWDHSSARELNTQLGNIGIAGITVPEPGSNWGGSCSSAVTSLQINFLYNQYKCLHAGQTWQHKCNPARPAKKCCFPALTEFQGRISSFSSCFPGWFLAWHRCSCWSCLTVADIPSPLGNSRKHLL